ncbi:hypothetical protein TOPH_08392 [Tolypocladium ophioglossoides CBS 100239]|uniref:Myb-like domain-containing protein n=1 Tax=Tolypocladium ophioglossoides (strain CBS 100239) TaxID=1163406 RepID=A0A0L0MYQ8_TOLOC|nr:hypothetical protein TOPH_08392 [Tolypocladium ophioglossoides CBS 100239]
MSRIFKSYDPFHKKQRAERRRHAKPRERPELSASGPPDEECLSGSTPRCSADDGDCSPIEGSDIIRDPLARFPSEEECLSLCFPATDVSSASTPASACSLNYQMGHFVLRWDSQDSAIDIQDDGPDSSSDTANFNTSDATPKAVLNGGDLCRGWESTDSISDDTCAQMASVSELNNRLLAQNAEALGILASAASAEQESASGISSSASVPGPSTQTFSTKRPLLDGDVPGESEGHDSEIYRSLKRSRRSDFNLHSSPRLESDDICPIPPSSRVCRGVDQSSQVPEDFGPQFRPGFHVDPSLIAPDHPSSQSADPMSLPTEQAESVRLELLVMQKMISSLLAKLGHGQAQITLPDGSVQRTPETRDETEGPSGDDSDDDTHNTSDSDSDSNSACDASELTTGAPEGTRQRSTQRCRWTKREEDLLGRLKNVGMLSDFQIARKLNRSENGVKQHWHIMSRANKDEWED